MEKEKLEIWKVLSNSAMEIEATKAKYGEFIKYYNLPDPNNYNKIFEKKGITIYKRTTLSGHWQPEIAIIFQGLKKALLLEGHVPYAPPTDLNKNQLTMIISQTLAEKFAPTMKGLLEERCDGYDSYDLGSDTSNDWGYLTYEKSIQKFVIDTKSGKGVAEEIIYYTKPYYTWME